MQYRFCNFFDVLMLKAAKKYDIMSIGIINQGGMPINGVSIYNQDIFNLIHAVEYINNNNIETSNMSIDFWDNSDVAITELENTMKNASNTLFVVAAGNNGVGLHKLCL